MATAKVKVNTKNTTKSKAKAPGSVTLHGLSPYVEKKNEEFMNQNQRDHFKLILRAWPIRCGGFTGSCFPSSGR